MNDLSWILTLIEIKLNYDDSSRVILPFTDLDLQSPIFEKISDPRLFQTLAWHQSPYFGRNLLKGREPIRTKSDFFKKHPGTPVQTEIISQEKAKFTIRANFRQRSVWRHHPYIADSLRQLLHDSSHRYVWIRMLFYNFSNIRRERIIVSVPSQGWSHLSNKI